MPKRDPFVLRCQGKHHTMTEIAVLRAPDGLAPGFVVGVPCDLSDAWPEGAAISVRGHYLVPSPTAPGRYVLGTVPAVWPDYPAPRLCSTPGWPRRWRRRGRVHLAVAGSWYTGAGVGSDRRCSR